MLIAQEVPEFGRRTLCACWHTGSCAGKKEVLPEYQAHIDTIDSLIGTEKRKEILNAPLPNFDGVIQLMKQKDIYFDIYPFLDELGAGNLKLTPTLEAAIQDYYDESLIRLGVSEKYKKALDYLTKKPRKLFERATDPFQKVETEYIQKADAMFRDIFPSTVKMCETLFDGITKTREKLKSDEYLNLITRTNKILEEVAELKSAYPRKMKPKKKFILYHNNMHDLAGNISSISSTLSWLAKYEYKGKGKEKEGDILLGVKNKADDLLKFLNRSVQEKMPGIYKLRLK
jgi:hypothetical protein